MKQIEKTCAGLALIVMISALSLTVFGESYNDEFDVLRQNDWELWGKNSMWQVKDGFLRTTIQAPDFSMGLFQFKGIPGNYENFDILTDDGVVQRQLKKPEYESFTITVDNLGSKSASFGIAIGRRLPDFPDPDFPHFYIFNTYFIDTQAYNWDTPNWWTHEEPLHPDTDWDTGELKSMEIRFDRGHFQWFADDEKRAEFEDPDFSQIEIIGFMIHSSGANVGSAWVDSFTISGPGLTVSPQAKFTTTWGHLKQHH